MYTAYYAIKGLCVELATEWQLKLYGQVELGHVRYINGLTWLQGFRANSMFVYLPSPKRDLDTKKTTPNIEVCPRIFIYLTWLIDVLRWETLLIPRTSLLLLK